LAQIRAIAVLLLGGGKLKGNRLLEAVDVINALGGT
jgi:hypothetical protein